LARHPDWFERLDSLTGVVRQAEHLQSLGRNEIKAIFACSERDSIRLLHKFGAQKRGDALSLPRSALLAQLEAIRAGSTYGAFLRQRQDVAKKLIAARAETAARQFPVGPAAIEDQRPSLQNLPQTVTWRRSAPEGPGRFEIFYRDGADLMRQLADFLAAAGVHREEFFAATEPAHDKTS
jgi:hypothetical protein